MHIESSDGILITRATKLCSILLLFAILVQGQVIKPNTSKEDLFPSDSIIRLISYSELKRYIPKKEIKHPKHHFHILVNGKEISFDSCRSLLHHFNSSSGEISKSEKIAKGDEKAITITSAPFFISCIILGAGSNSNWSATFTNDILIGWAADFALIVMTAYVFHIGYYKHLKRAIFFYNKEIFNQRAARRNV